MNNNEITTLTPVPAIPANTCSSLQAPPVVIDHPPSSIQHPASSLDHPASSFQLRASRPHFRNGKIARLPKLERDMVNRMLHNHVPYAKIVGALDELGIKVTERNVSNWKTRGGYQEWCAEQERQINLSRLQDNLVDYLRKNDASQLPEVGLQVASTQLSLALLQPETTKQLAANPKNYCQVVDMLCRVSTRIQSLQKDRDEGVNQAAIRGTSEQLKREDEKTAEQIRWVYSSKMGEGPRDPNISHRNELPKRDQLPFQEPPPKRLSFLEKLEYVRRTGRSLPGIPAPQPKPAENPTGPAGVIVVSD